MIGFSLYGGVLAGVYHFKYRKMKKKRPPFYAEYFKGYYDLGWFSGLYFDILTEMWTSASCNLIWGSHHRLGLAVSLILMSFYILALVDSVYQISRGKMEFLSEDLALPEQPEKSGALPSITHRRVLGSV